MSGDGFLYRHMQPHAGLLSNMLGNLLTHGLSPKTVNVFGYTLFRLRGIGVGFVEIAYLISHSN